MSPCQRGRTNASSNDRPSADDSADGRVRRQRFHPLRRDRARRTSTSGRSRRCASSTPTGCRRPGSSRRTPSPRSPIATPNRPPSASTSGSRRWPGSSSRSSGPTRCSTTTGRTTSRHTRATCSRSTSTRSPTRPTWPSTSSCSGTRTTCSPVKAAHASSRAATSDASGRPASIGTTTSPASSSSPVRPERSSCSTTGCGTPANRTPATPNDGCTRCASTRPVRQVRLWNTADLDDLQNPPSDHVFARMQPDSVAQIFRTWHPWMSVTDYRNEQVQRALLWRYLTGDDALRRRLLPDPPRGPRRGRRLMTPTPAGPVPLGVWVVTRFVDGRMGVPRRDRRRGPRLARGRPALRHRRPRAS